jgi:hypothetical protein
MNFDERTALDFLDGKVSPFIYWQDYGLWVHQEHSVDSLCDI